MIERKRHETEEKLDDGCDEENNVSRTGGWVENGVPVSKNEQAHRSRIHNDSECITIRSKKIVTWAVVTVYIIVALLTVLSHIISYNVSETDTLFIISATCLTIILIYITLNKYKDEYE